MLSSFAVVVVACGIAAWAEVVVEVIVIPVVLPTPLPALLSTTVRLPVVCCRLPDMTLSTARSACNASSTIWPSVLSSLRLGSSGGVAVGGGSCLVLCCCAAMHSGVEMPLK